MGNIPKISQSVIIPVNLPVPDYLADHHFQGQPVLPAVEAMEILARTAKTIHPDVSVDHLSDIRFDRFLPLDPSSGRLDASVELRASESQGWEAALMSRTRTPKAAITRTKVHARLTFRRHDAPQPRWPLDVAAVPEGICLSVDPKSVYKELVPFGPAFRNIVSPIHISPDGAIARIKTPLHKGIAGSGRCLGSPYALDAAMHAACVWSQHYRGVVAFPVAIEERTILSPIQADSIYYGRVKPRNISDDRMIFDIAVLDENGGLCELSSGVQMRDVSGGRLKPPEWILRVDESDPLALLKVKSGGLTIIESDAVAPFAIRTLTSGEKKRFEKQGRMRQKSYLAGRLALKRLYRRCRGEDWSTAADCIETVQCDSPLPCCKSADAVSDANLHCSLSHDRRLAVAVAGSEPVGIDIERIFDNALESAQIYMHPDERQQVLDNALGEEEAAVRIWSIKEAAAKIFGMNLAEAWHQVRVTRIGRESSRFEMDGSTHEAYHAQVDEHVVSLIIQS